MGKLKLRNIYENRHVDTEGEGEGGMNWESSWRIYTTVSEIDD